MKYYKHFCWIEINWEFIIIFSSVISLWRLRLSAAGTLFGFSRIPPSASSWTRDHSDPPLGCRNPRSNPRPRRSSRYQYASSNFRARTHLAQCLLRNQFEPSNYWTPKALPGHQSVFLVHPRHLLPKSLCRSPSTRRAGRLWLAIHLYLYLFWAKLLQLEDSRLRRGILIYEELHQEYGS